MCHLLRNRKNDPRGDSEFNRMDTINTHPGSRVSFSSVANQGPLHFQGLR